MKAIFCLGVAVLSLLVTNVQAQQIDSIIKRITPAGSVGIAPVSQLAFDIYVSDTSLIDSICIKLGFEADSADVFRGSYPVIRSFFRNDNYSGAAYYNITTLNCSNLPRFISAYLHKRDQTFSTEMIVQLYE
jgi:hypothetical protein